MKLTEQYLEFYKGHYIKIHWFLHCEKYRLSMQIYKSETIATMISMESYTEEEIEQLQQFPEWFIKRARFIVDYYPGGLEWECNTVKEMCQRRYESGIRDFGYSPEESK